MQEALTPPTRRLLALLLVSFASLGGCTTEPACHEDEGCADGGHGAHGSEGGGGATTTPTPAERYCDCMLSSCHDAYHATFGPDSDEPAARAACLAEAEALPSVGMDVDMGNSVECRIHYCSLGDQSATTCDAAVGLGSCAP
ncbi:MAG: hypothetical protein KC731_01655 [Myxococcales bacterium]|nr:hypothetical protein [Myxococcales bacterium]